MRGPEKQAGQKGTAGAGPGVGSRSQCIPLLAGAMEDAFRAAGVTAQVNLREPKVHLFPARLPDDSMLHCEVLNCSGTRFASTLGDTYKGALHHISAPLGA